ncbi:MAG: crotonase/enoyl-CoA hydratase family protein [Streptosporangiaceae bacterium]|jgi:enoyl-CoA hydratase
MGALVSYRRAGSMATITMNDGKVNALSPEMLSQLSAALHRAEADGVVVLLTGRDGVFCAGFDLAVVRAGGAAAVSLLRGGFELAARILAFPAPVLVACTGHAVAMGAFLLLSADDRIGAAGPYRITANEVAIGMTLPAAAIEICRQRVGPEYLTRVLALAEVLSPEDAVTAGFLDRVVPAAQLRETAAAGAARLATLDRAAHAASKARLRAPVLGAIRAAIEADFPAGRA